MKHTVKAKNLASWTGYKYLYENGQTIESVSLHGSNVKVVTIPPLDQGNYSITYYVYGEVDVDVYGPETVTVKRWLKIDQGE